MLKFKRDKHARDKARIVEYLQHLTAPSIPSELLKLVVEAAVKSSIFFFSMDQSSSLESVAGTVFAKWPEDLQDNTRHLLQQETVDAILGLGLVKIIADYTSRYILPVPPALHGFENMLRYLLLDFRADPETAGVARDITRGGQDMGHLTLRFPRLEVCIILLHFHRRMRTLVFPGRPGVIPVEAIPNSPVIYKPGPNMSVRVSRVEILVMEFIDAFLEEGPGKRKFLRISHGAENSSVKLLGPLTRVSKHKSSSSALLEEQTATTRETRSTADAQRIFQEAFWGKAGPRGDWKASFCE